MSRYRFIATEKATYPVSLLCRVLDVSRASFYAWCDRGPRRDLRNGRRNSPRTVQ